MTTVLLLSTADTDLLAARAASSGTTSYRIGNPSRVDPDADLPALLEGADVAVVRLLGGDEEFLDGCRVGAVWGTHWHGSLESDGFRREFLRRVAAQAGRRFVPAPSISFAALREAQLDRLADLIDAHMDTAALLRLIEDGAPAGLPFLPPGAP